MASTDMKQTTLDGSDNSKGSKRTATDPNKDDQTNEQTTNGKAEEEGAPELPPSKKSKTEGVDSAEAPELGEGVLERGTIHFVYKPKVEEDDPSGIDDISKLHVILSPREGNRNSKPGYRLISIGKKQMPSPKTHQPMWATVASVGKDKSELKENLGESTYETKTRGTRRQPAARPVGVGAYVLHSKKSSGGTGGTTYLAYALATPSSEGSGDDVGKVQKDLNVFQEASVILQVKDPKQDGPPQASLPPSRRASYPNSLLALFRTKFIQANPPQLLDYVGAELLLIGGRKGGHDVAQEIGEEAKETVEEDADGEEQTPEDILKELQLDAKQTDTAPIEGNWA